MTHKMPNGTTKVGGLAPAFIALLFVALAVGLIVLYRGRDGSPSQPRLSARSPWTRGAHRAFSRAPIAEGARKERRRRRL